MNTNSTLLQLWLAWDKRCAYCGKQTKLKTKDRLVRATKDHYIPKKLGGPDTMENYVLSCQPCNQFKDCLHPGEFLGRKKRLRFETLIAHTE